MMVQVKGGLFIMLTIKLTGTRRFAWGGLRNKNGFTLLDQCQNLIITKA